ncbi:RNA polymerase sigma factor [Candidatus Poribacteria bacterium]|nr:RNA polymerase sigma factor [Candidatus Poribacteria bacterium]
MKNDDVQLIERTLAGDESAFSALVRKYQKPVHAFVRRKVGDFHIAEEITQDIFLRVYERLQTLKNPSTFVRWLYVIAARQCFAWFEKKRMTMKSLDAMSPEELEELAYAQYRAEQQDEFANEQYREVVKHLLQKLPESERTVVTLHYLSNMTCEDISKFLGVSPNTVKSRLHRARNRLKKEKSTIREIWKGSKGNFIMSAKLEDIRGKFHAYREHMRSNPSSAEVMLTEVNNEIEDALKAEITPELVHLAVDEIYPYMGSLGMEKRIPLLRKYMNDALDDTERYWSHQGLVNTLAFLRRDREVIEEQTRLYHWACKQSEKYVLRIIANQNTAGSWKAEGRINDWIQLYNETSERLEIPEVSQYSRCDFLQKGAAILQRNDRLDAALLEIEKLERAYGKPGWRSYFKFWLAVREIRLLLYSKKEDWDCFDQVYTETNTFIEGELKKLEAGFPVNLYECYCVAHNVGCCLVWSKRYTEGKRLLQLAIDLGNYTEYSHFQFAVSIWASEKDREKTLHHLKIAQDAYVVRGYNYQDSYYPSFLETPEFSDVKDDPEFLKVLGQK